MIIMNDNQVGGILSPYVNMLSDVWIPTPNIIYGSLAVLGEEDHVDDDSDLSDKSLLWWF